MQESNWITVSGPDLVWAGLFQVRPVFNSQNTHFYHRKFYMSSKEHKEITDKIGYQQLMFITQRSSVTVDGILWPTVNALLSEHEDFLRSLSYWKITGVKFHFELQNNQLVNVLQWQQLLEIFLFNSHYSKILPVGRRKETQTAKCQTA